MRRSKLRLPVLTVRTLLLVCGALVVVCVGVGLAMRASLTDYAHDGAAVEQLPFVVDSRASTDALSLHTREEIAAAADYAALTVGETVTVLYRRHPHLPQNGGGRGRASRRGRCGVYPWDGVRGGARGGPHCAHGNLHG